MHSAQPPLVSRLSVCPLISVPISNPEVSGRSSVHQRDICNCAALRVARVLNAKTQRVMAARISGMAEMPMRIAQPQLGYCLFSSIHEHRNRCCFLFVSFDRNLEIWEKCELTAVVAVAVRMTTFTFTDIFSFSFLFVPSCPSRHRIRNRD